MKSTNGLAPGFLVASPRLDGSVFERSVIIMIHHDEEGAMGFIANKPLEVDFGSLLEMVEIDQDRVSEDCYDHHVFFGGPVRVEQLWVIHQFDPEAADEATPAEALEAFASLEDLQSLDDSAELQFHDAWKLTGTADSIEEFAYGANLGVFRPYIGYTGWGPGQLETEIEEGSWLMLDFDEEFVFDHNFETLWDHAVDRLGIDETIFTMMGKAGSA